MNCNSEKFSQRFAQLEIPENVNFTVKKARYAKDKIAISFESDGTGLKTSSNRLFNEVVGYGGYSNREHAYIVSITKVEKFLKMLQ